MTSLHLKYTLPPLLSGQRSGDGSSLGTTRRRREKDPDGRTQGTVQDPQNGGLMLRRTVESERKVLFSDHRVSPGIFVFVVFF